ncbi:MAG: hypothetical protein RRA92_02315 [Gemmatimonadota bacterium]|nr:hypothetical protein [Gemmatimonadota bacterium]
MIHTLRVRRWLIAAAVAIVAPVLALTGCDDDPLFELLPDPPAAPSGVAVAVSGTNVTVTWTPGDGATSQRVEITPSGGTAITQAFDDNTTNSAAFTGLEPGGYTAVVTAINAGGETASGQATFTIAAALPVPVLSSFTEKDGDPTTLVVSWDALAGVDGFRVELAPAGGGDVLTQSVGAAVTSVEFGQAQGVLDGVEYTARLFALVGADEAGSNTLSFAVNHFPWDEYFPTSLHVTGAGKPYYYGTNPNLGFERFTDVPYTDLACQGCHLSDSGFPGPATGKTCDRCHDTAEPQLGAEVDATLAGACGTCHSRQKLEAANFSDVHATMGFDCMACHTSEDVHGDGNEYRTMIEDGAIDAECEACHDPATHPAGADPHGGKVYCTSCHAQSIVTCNNCHFESEVFDEVKIFKTPPSMNWIFLLNRTRNGEEKVYPGNYQSVVWQDKSLVAFGPYTPHTIAPAVDARDCEDCHQNFGGSIPAIEEYNATGQIQVVSYNDATGALETPAGVVPFPHDFLTSLQFDFVTLDEFGDWVFLKAGADTIQILPEFVRPLDAGQMSDLGMTGP